MKLAYIYIQSHKVLENINIPINGSHKCKYLNNRLTLSFHPNELDYYEGIDCSAIIGKNGVGKSTILNFLEEAYDGTDSSGIIVWFNNTTKKYHICAINIYIDDNSIVSNQDYIFEKNFSNFTKKNKIKLLKANNLTGIETNDFLPKRKSNSFIHDISLSQYAKNNRKTITKRTKQLIQYFNTSRSFNNSEQPTVKFKFKFSMSSTSYLRSLLNDKKFVTDYIKSDKSFDLLKQYLFSTHYNNVNLNEYEEFFPQLQKANLLSICSYLSKLPAIRKYHRDAIFIDLIIGITDADFNETYLKNILFNTRNELNINYYEKNFETDVRIITEKYQEIIRNLKKVSETIYFFKNQYQSQKPNTLETFNPELIIQLTDCITKLPPMLLNNFKYGWNGFSTGEFAKLNLFSELYSYIRSQKNNGINNHLIVMDEVDLYLHPDWQRTFFSELLEFIRIEFPEKTAQIILSTHSPIIISDFLPEDIVSLDRNNSKTKLVESFGFATNITDLYVEGMHLSSTFGEHSKKAINKLLARAKNNDLSEQDINLIKKIKSKNIQQMILDYNDQN
ncbi:AAA family ATPase [Acinetobacter gyllenbergii]|uniref:AAA family ATPase n=1 Tax=Acinetobacter gyllenbergii TaxID=134534 RepID=UPI000806908D|nr:AAA family ATPase [Acinetobacter gyllenbergii]OBY73713.1 hypothetical protein NG55_13740 [Acinetobacter gyllenbergii]